MMTPVKLVHSVAVDTIGMIADGKLGHEEMQNVRADALALAGFADMRIGDGLLAGEVLPGLAAEIARQDRVHPAGYPATRDGVRLGIATGVDELDEAYQQWRLDRCRCETPLCGHADWQGTRAEMLQAAAVIARAIRSIDQHHAQLVAAEEAEDRP